MIEIEFTMDSVEGEDGPNLYLKGEPDDYLKLFNRLHSLGKENGDVIQSDELKDIFMDSNNVIRFVSKEKTNTILKKMDNVFLMELDKGFWQGIFEIIISVSYGRGHSYIEDDIFNRSFYLGVKDTNKIDFVQDTGMIISSEW
jgi:hypothetical protein